MNGFFLDPGEGEEPEVYDSKVPYILAWVVVAIWDFLGVVPMFISSAICYWVLLSMKTTGVFQNIETPLVEELSWEAVFFPLVMVLALAELSFLIRKRSGKWMFRVKIWSWFLLPIMTIVSFLGVEMETLEMFRGPIMESLKIFRDPIFFIMTSIGVGYVHVLQLLKKGALEVP